MDWEWWVPYIFGVLVGAVLVWLWPIIHDWLD